jgi:hypothetical protein
MQHRQKLDVGQDNIVLCMIDGVEDLLWRQPHVDRVQNGAHHRHGEGLTPRLVSPEASLPTLAASAQ